MLKKIAKISGIIILCLIAIRIVGNLTGVCGFYTVPTTGCEPNIKLGSYIVTTNLKTPKRGDIIIYDFNHPEFGEATWIHRLCAVENDVVEIREGVLFVNGKNFDEQYNLQHSYLLSLEKLNSLNDDTIENFPIIDKENKIDFIAFVTDVDARTYKLAKYRYRDLKTIPNPEIKRMYQQDWNKDHFGPLVVPEGKIFVLGDNRDNSQDSRVIGLIDASAIKGVYWKKLYTASIK